MFLILASNSKELSGTAGKSHRTSIFAPGTDGAFSSQGSPATLTQSRLQHELAQQQCQSIGDFCPHFQ